MDVLRRDSLLQLREFVCCKNGYPKKRLTEETKKKLSAIEMDALRRDPLQQVR